MDLNTLSWDWLFLQPIHLLAILINSYYCCIMQVVSKVWRSVWFLMIVEFLTALFIFGIFSLNFFFSVPLLFCILPRPSSKAQRSKWRCGFWRFWWYYSYMQITFFPAILTAVQENLYACTSLFCVTGVVWRRVVQVIPGRKTKVFQQWFLLDFKLFNIIFSTSVKA